MVGDRLYIYPQVMTDQITKRLILYTALAAAFGIGIGVIIGYFGRGETFAPVIPPEADSNAGKAIADAISNENIEENLR